MISWLPLISGCDPPTHLASERRRGLGFRQRSPSAEPWLSSDGRGLKETCQLLSMVLTGWVTLSPSTCPWHCAFLLVTVKSRSHWTQRPESRTISPPILSPSLLCTAKNVAFTSLWKTLGIVPQETTNHLQEVVSGSCEIKRLQGSFTSSQLILLIAGINMPLLPEFLKATITFVSNKLT